MGNITLAKCNPIQNRDTHALGDYHRVTVGVKVVPYGQHLPEGNLKHHLFFMAPCHYLQQMTHR